MRLTVIGCSGSFAGPESAASCYLLEGEHEGRTWRVLLDLGSGALGTLQRYVDPLTSVGIDTLILGCTHYPLLTGIVSYVMGDQVTLVSSAEETAKDVYRLLVQHGLERDASLPEPEHRFLTTGQPAEFASIGRRFLGPELEQVAQLATATSWVTV